MYGSGFREGAMTEIGKEMAAAVQRVNDLLEAASIQGLRTEAELIDCSCVDMAEYRLKVRLWREV
jgi:hypothetical protein